ncbi:MAG: tRNA methyltransferase ppm2 [Geoglossum umbratile]|nr:MAG: tRNA methyltransferase ppm2 [Geoglossum umbratile]
MQLEKDMSHPRGKEKRDESAMGTNNSSIVSKRSVERLYCPGEDFFRYFVKKPQRRSPTINRGYWLRMQTLEHVVHKFLEEPTGKTKILVNLGDPLPFQFLAKNPEKCRNIKFIDVDYTKLMTRKCSVIMETEQLRRLLSGVELPVSQGNVVLRSDQYLAVGCDLRELEDLERTLVGEVDIENCLVLFTAEVSVTYMEVEAADALIKWAAARFCLLEQFLPDGPENPFADTMLRHFKKLSTPLRSIHKYPLIEDQQRRFRDAGWPVAVAHDLWKLWSMPGFLTTGQRTSLNSVEPFDEWEELALFASHYFLLFAGKNPFLKGEELYRILLQEDIPSGKTENNQNTRDTAATAFCGSAKHQGRRRFAAAAPLVGGGVAYHGGLGAKTRLNSCELISHDGNADTKIPRTLPGSRPRMCHTLTSLEGGQFLLVGGRSSPDNALADCWIYDLHTTEWYRAEDIAIPRYRHCAVGLPNAQVLVFGGKTSNGDVLDDCLVWGQNSGWKSVCVKGDIPPASFGAAMIAAVSGGILLGGMTAEGIVLEGYWEWNFEMDNEGAFIKFRSTSSQFKDVIEVENPFCRFGSSLAWSPLGSGILLIGGIHGTRMLGEDNEILLIDNTNYSVATLNLDFGARRPLFVGSSVVSTPEAMLIIGGGATCFSFGTYWNDGLWALSVDGQDRLSWRFQENVAGSSSSDVRPTAPSHTISHVQRISIKSGQDFEALLSKAQPAILEGLDIGDCIQNWTFTYLKERIGAGRQVIVHKAQREHMDFQAKNFSYVSQNFGDFLDAVEGGQKLYLRSVSSEEPASKPAVLSQDFPEISGDFRLPPELDFIIQNAHSSPLRISGPVVMWLHYDVMANVLCQVRGDKRLLLYPPDDVGHLCFPPGASSSSLNVFESNPETYPHLAHTHPHQVVLHPGDILFIPALWLHTASPTDGVSVSVNVFFRNLRTGYAVGRDVYGNRDLQPYEKGRLNLARMVQSFEQLPVDVGKFYLRRLADELVQKANAYGLSESVSN